MNFCKIILAALLISAGVIGQKAPYRSPVTKLAVDKSCLESLHCAARVGETEAIRVLLSKGFDPNAKDEKGLTPLHWAARRLVSDSVATLVNAGADLNAKDKMGFTPLHLAAQFGRAENAAELIRGGADLNMINHEHITPLGIAGRYHNYNVTKTLSAGAKEDYIYGPEMNGIRILCHS